MRAIPEKTLEHWASMYLARRFPSCQLWWPTVHEDIAVQGLSSRVGKSLLLEVKTTDWSSQRNEHRLTVDVGQQGRYLSSPIPVYYVLPMPPWTEVLVDGHGWLKGRSRSELIDSGHGWFGNWLFVVRAQTLWTWLGWRQKQSSATLFANRGGPNDPSSIWPNLTPWWRWADFWDEMARCGSRAMPSMFTCPTNGGPIGYGAWSSRQALVERLTLGNGERDLDRSSVEVEVEVERLIPNDGGDAYRPVLEDDIFELGLTTSAAGRSTAYVHLCVTDLDF